MQASPREVSMIDIVYRFDPDGPPLAPQPTSPEEARQRLCQGNQEFARLVDPPRGSHPAQRVIPIDLSDFGASDKPGHAPRQQPFAIVLGCSDARVPIELVFGQACNDLFVVRVAGNVLGSECLGSIEYAVANLRESVQLLVVLGHSGCGAVTAAVDAYLGPARYLSVANTQALRAIVDRVMISARAADQSLMRVHGREVRRKPGYRAALIELTVVVNAALTAKTLRRELQGFRKFHGQVAYGVYHLLDREVSVPVGAAGSDVKGLLRPPHTTAEIQALGEQAARSRMIEHLLSESR
jgi:carbonic anhydrase